MTSIVGYNFRLKPGEQIPNWAQFDWPLNIEHDIYRDWGTYYFNRRRDNLALQYYTKSLDIDDDDYMTLYRRSQTQRKAARIEWALRDATRAAKMAMSKHGPNCPINLQICDALFELNKFEASSMELQDNMKKFIGVKAKTFQKRLSVINDVITDVTGKAMSSFFLKNQKLIRRVDEINKAKAIVDNRVLWKKLRDQGKCDILSILQIEEEILSPMEIERRKRAFHVFNQTYINESWYDVVFMKKLRKNPSLLLQQCKSSRHFLEDLSYKQYDVLKQFMVRLTCIFMYSLLMFAFPQKMLQSRSPLYYVSYLKYPNKKRLERNKEAYLFRIQYQTHRNMIADLRHVRKLREEKRIKSLGQYVEKVMGDYYVLKRDRVMCWKFEFINEIYNTLALALCEQYYVPRNFRNDRKAMQRLLHMKSNKVADIVQFVFGDRSTYQESTDQDVEGTRVRQYMSRLERRFLFAKYAIEKCYIYHEMATVHLSQLHYDECCFNARRAIKESRNCNSLIWNFLSVVQIIKANVMQHKLERTKEALEDALAVVVQLKSPPLRKFIKMCIINNDMEYSRKQSSLASQRSSKISGISSMQPSLTSVHTVASK
ncbi:hypothetical protein KR222_000109 [Zaprionus bogoriensis]|nr:hypothetical protein KR222_000109 [Zaprionus bogoriensis]